MTMRSVTIFMFLLVLFVASGCRETAHPDRHLCRGTVFDYRAGFDDWTAIHQRCKRGITPTPRCLSRY